MAPLTPIDHDETVLRQAMTQEALALTRIVSNAVYPGLLKLDAQFDVLVEKLAPGGELNDALPQFQRALEQRGTTVAELQTLQTAAGLLLTKIETMELDAIEYSTGQGEAIPLFDLSMPAEEEPIP